MSEPIDPTKQTDLTDEQARQLSESNVTEQIMRRLRLPREARWSYFQDGNGPMFIWNTERLRMRNEKDIAHGMFESGVAVSYGPGSRSNKGKAWKVLEESRSLHTYRKDAKMRAFKLYLHWQKTGKVEL